MTISQTAGDVRARARQGAIGQPVFSTPLDVRRDAINEDPQAANIWTLTPVAANDATYTVTVGGVSASYTADASATLAEITAGLTLAINAEPLMRGTFAPTDGGTIVTLTGLNAGISFTPTGSTTGGGSLTPAETQVAATADVVPFGRLVVDDGSPSPYGNDLLGQLAKSAGFTAQVHTAVIIFVASAIYTFTVSDETGAVIASGSTDAITDTATTAAAVLVTLNGLLPADSVIVTNPSAGDIVFTSELAGREFSVEFGTNEEGQAGSALTSQTDTTGPSKATSVNRAAIGISLYSTEDPTPTIGGTVGEYAANAGMKLLAGGNSVWVERPGVVSFGDPAFVELDGSGSDAGKFFSADSATRVRLTGVSWLRDGVDTTDTIAALRVDL